MNEARELGAFIGEAVRSSNKYKQDFIETEEAADLNIVALHTVGLSTSLLAYSVDIGNHFVLDHPVNSNLDFDGDMKAAFNFEGDATDLTGFGNDGTPGAGATITASGISGSAYSFNGATNARILCGNDASLQFNDAVSISVWVKINTLLTGNRKIVSKGDRTWTVGFGTNGNLPDFNIHDGTTWQTCTANGTISTGAWHHYVGTWGLADSTARLYVDGVLQSDTATAGKLNDSGVNGYTAYEMCISGNPEATGREINGIADSVGVWNRVLEQREITDLYNSGVGYHFPYSVAHAFLLDEGLRGSTLIESIEG